MWSETGIVEKFAASELTPKWRVRDRLGLLRPDRRQWPRLCHGPHHVAQLHGAGALLRRAEQATKLWSHAYECHYGRIGYPAGPRASVTIDDGKAYALGATGRLHVFDAASGKSCGKRTWSSNTHRDADLGHLGRRR